MAASWDSGNRRRTTEQAQDTTWKMGCYPLRWERLSRGRQVEQAARRRAYHHTTQGTRAGRDGAGASSRGPHVRTWWHVRGSAEDPNRAYDYDCYCGVELQVVRSDPPGAAALMALMTPPHASRGPSWWATHPRGCRLRKAERGQAVRTTAIARAPKLPSAKKAQAIGAAACVRRAITYTMKWAGGPMKRRAMHAWLAGTARRLGPVLMWRRETCGCGLAYTCDSCVV